MPDAGAERFDCPEPCCPSVFTPEKMVTHLQWNHGYSQYKAESIVERELGVDVGGESADESSATAEVIEEWEEENDESHPVFEAEHRPERESVSSERQEDLVYGGVCPVCGDEFTDGFHRLQDLEGESIEGVRICVIDPPEECLFHLPEDQSDRSQDTATDHSGGDRDV